MSDTDRMIELAELYDINITKSEPGETSLLLSTLSYENEMRWLDKNGRTINIGDMVHNGESEHEMVSSLSVVEGKPVVVYCNHYSLPKDTYVLFLPRYYAGFDFCEDVEVVGE